MRSILLGALVAMSGCLNTHAVSCGESVCVEGATCDVATSTCLPPGCGNGKLDPGEDCDGDQFALRDCTALGFYDAHPLGCTNRCTYDASACTGSCGDRAVNGDELCDGVPPPGQSCIDYGFGEGRLGCSTACTPTFETCNQLGWPVAFRETQGALTGLARRAGTDQTYVFGDQGVVLATDTHLATPPVQVALPQDLAGAPIRGVWGEPGVVDGDLFVASEDGIVAHLHGGTWTEADTGIPLLGGLTGTSVTDVYAVGGNGLGQGKPYIFHFDGAAWTSDLTSALTADLLDATATPDGTIVAVGEKGTILRHVPGAARGTWTQDVTPACSGCTAYTLNAVAGVGGHVFAAGTNGGLPNGAAYVLVERVATPGTWDVVGTGAAEVGTSPDRFDNEIDAIAGTELDDIYFGGADGLLLHFDGAVFHRVDLETTRAIKGLVVPERGRAIAATFGGAMLAYANVEWTDVGAIANAAVDFESAAASHGDWLAGGTGGALLESTDGVTWTDANGTGITNAFVGVSIVPSDDRVQFAVAVTPASAGSGFIAVRDAGPATTFQAMTLPGNLTANWGAVWARSRNDYFLAGAKSTLPWVVHCTSGSAPAGCASEAVPVTRATKIIGLWGGAQAGDPVFALSAAGDIVVRDASGTWTVSTTTHTTMNGIWGSSPTDVFAVGYSGAVFHFDGAAWSRQLDDGIETLFSVGGTGPADVYVGAADGILHYDGVAWTPVAQPVLSTVSAIVDGSDAKRARVLFVGSRATSATLERTHPATGTGEARCTDGFDDDFDGAIDCADHDCAADPACQRGGVCEIAETLACGSTIAVASTFSGSARVDQLPGIHGSTSGAEATYLIEADAGRTVTVAATGIASGATLSAVVLDTYADTNACDLSHAIATATSTADGVQIQFPVAANGKNLLVIDEATAASDFALAVRCE